jgi:hypothetical protein
MNKPEDMPEFVEGFFQQSVRFEAAIRGETVGGIAQPAIGNHSKATVELGLTEHKGENGDEEIFGNHSEDFAPIVAPGPAPGSFKRVNDLARIVLHALGGEESLEVEIQFMLLNPGRQSLCEAIAEIAYHAPITSPERHQDNRFHDSRFSPYFSIL